MKELKLTEGKQLAIHGTRGGSRTGPHAVWLQSTRPNPSTRYNFYFIWEVKGYPELGFKKNVDLLIEKYASKI